MIKPVEYNGDKFWVTFRWPKDKPNEGHCMLFRYLKEGGVQPHRKDILAVGSARRNPKDTNNRKVARQVAFGRMLKQAGEGADALPPEVIQQLSENFLNRGKRNCRLQ